MKGLASNRCFLYVTTAQNCLLDHSASVLGYVWPLALKSTQNNAEAKCSKPSQKYKNLLAFWSAPASFGWPLPESYSICPLEQSLTSCLKDDILGPTMNVLVSWLGGVGQILLQKMRLEKAAWQTPAPLRRLVVHAAPGGHTPIPVPQLALNSIHQSMAWVCEHIWKWTYKVIGSETEKWSDVGRVSCLEYLFWKTKKISQMPRTSINNYKMFTQINICFYLICITFLLKMLWKKWHQ